MINIADEILDHVTAFIKSHNLKYLHSNIYMKYTIRDFEQKWVMTSNENHIEFCREDWKHPYRPTKVYYSDPDLLNKIETYLLNYYT